MKQIDIRRSIRKFKDKPIDQNQIEAILRAGMQAPSAGNQRPWEFLVIRNKACLEKLADMSPYSKMVADAPLAIVLLGIESRMMFKENWQQDMGACAQNILLEIVDQKLGGVWLGVAPLEDRIKYVKEVLDLKDEIPFAIIPFGHPQGENKYIDRYEEDRIKYID